ncbi:WYL domain-containing protein [Tessaracoccus sp. MC1756]|uniref:helix-turn-helix transcriptional regulator n=1 Tax=Tessaracoccus sp. MC1756 TaxID=2760311 RepID=UPI0015FFD64F|nr:WYL domain-containing protein [Tessaracoccus sp. MC1756]
MRSEEQLARLLRLVPYLSSHPGIEVAKVAEEFGVTPRQVIRDLEVLQFCGLPGGYFDDLFDVDIDVVREEGHIDFRNADVLARPLRLRPAEAAGLLAALRLVVDVAGRSDAAASALKKLEAAVGEADAHVSVAVESTDPQRRAALSRAVEQRRAVQLEYRTTGRQGTTTAVVEPARLNLVDGYTYLDAWSRSREAWRSYRLDRVVAVEVLDQAAGDHGAPPDGWFDDVPDRLTLTVQPSARWIAEYFPTVGVEDLGDRVAVTFPVASHDWAVSLILRLGGAVLDVSDDRVAQAARVKAGRALAGYPEVVR